MTEELAPTNGEREQEKPDLRHTLNVVIENNRMRYPLVASPEYRVKMGDTNVELWASPRRMPFLLHADVMVVPVSPDLKMVFGAAKLARDAGAGIMQVEAEAFVQRNGPLAPGDAFIGKGGKYHFKYTALAVIFDDQKRTDLNTIRQAIRKALELAYEKGARTAILADITENVQAQPNWITPEQRKRETEAAAIALLEAVRASKGVMRTIKIWTWNKANLDSFIREFKRLERNG